MVRQGQEAVAAGLVEGSANEPSRIEVAGSGARGAGRRWQRASAGAGGGAAGPGTPSDRKTSRQLTRQADKSMNN